MFTITQIGQRASAEYEAGQIIEQSPTAGKTVRDNREITVFVSTGVKSAEMPNVVNQEHRAASIQLRQLDLNLVIDDSAEEYSDSVSAGYVIRSSPAAGEMLQDGDVVMLTISRGPEVPPATVTTLTSIPLAQAQEIAGQLGLVVAVDYANSDDVPVDYVISQSIAPRTQVAQGSTIKLTVSLGPEVAAPEPDVPEVSETGTADAETEAGA